jgi:hypothetical protein
MAPVTGDSSLPAPALRAQHRKTEAASHVKRRTNFRIVPLPSQEVIVMRLKTGSVKALKRAVLAVSDLFFRW